jgi:hypothetical protein
VRNPVFSKNGVSFTTQKSIKKPSFFQKLGFLGFLVVLIKKVLKNQVSLRNLVY